MKTTKYLAAALLLLSVLSCQKEQIDNPVAENVIITCTFAANDDATKTTIDTDGFTPLWAEGDQILIYDASNSVNVETITLISSGTPSENQGLISSGNKSFTFTKPDGWGTDVCALYPASAYVTFDDNDVQFNFTGQDGTFGKANICAAKTSSTRMSFTNVGAILKFTSKPANVMNVLVPEDMMKDNYKISFASGTPELSSVTASNKPEVSLDNGTGVVYIGVPACAIAAGSTFEYRSSSRGVLGTYTTKSANTVERNKIYNLGSISADKDQSFTVNSDSKKVYFSQGNLWYSSTDGKYHLESEQNVTYSLLGQSGHTEAHVIHFFWSSVSDWQQEGKEPWRETYSYSSQVLTDNFFCSIANPLSLDGQSGLYTLTSSEWSYLFQTRANASQLYRRASVATSAGKAYCYVIAPDGWNFTENPLKINYTASEWAAAQSEGLVCLPVTGWYNGSIFKNSDTGFYWSSSLVNATMPYYVNLGTSSVNPVDKCKRNYGYSVRLVYTAQ